MRFWPILEPLRQFITPCGKLRKIFVFSFLNIPALQSPGHQRHPVNQNNELLYNRRSEQEANISHKHSSAENTQHQSQPSDDRYVQPKNEQNHNAQQNESSGMAQEEQLVNQQPRPQRSSNQPNNQQENTSIVFQHRPPNDSNLQLDQGIILKGC